MTHAELVQISGRVADQIGAWRSWPDPIPPWSKGEHPDRFGLFRDSTPEAWQSNDGEPVPIKYADTFVIECKASPQDEAPDWSKEWRGRLADGMGNIRIFVARPGLIDPSDLIGTPWGLWEVKDFGEFRMIAAPQRVNAKNTAAELMLLASIASGASGENGPGSNRKRSSRLDDAEAVLAKDGRMRVGKLRRRVGITTRPDLFAEQLAGDARFHVETEAGVSEVELAEQTEPAQ